MTINLDHVTEQITVTDAASNASLTVNTKGTGAFNVAAGSSGVNISNGGTVTAVTITTIGNNYTSAPTWTASAPTTAGGVQASGTTTLQISSVVVAGGGTGYTVGDILTFVGGTFTTAVQVQVTTVSSGVITKVVAYNNGNYTVAPSNPVSVTGGTGSGATFTLGLGLRLGGLTITNAGSGYVEQPTVSFSGGGGAGAAAYAAVGSTPKIQTVADTLDFYGPNNTAIMRLFNKNTSGYPTNSTTPAFSVTPPQSNFGTTVLASSTQLYLVSGNTGTMVFQTAATSPTITTNSGTSQFQVAHTGSAVNVVQATGAATGNLPNLSAAGSDTNISLQLSGKGTGTVNLSSNGNPYAVQVQGTASGSNYNNFRLTSGAGGSGASSTPVMSTWGIDTNIALALQSKGTGGIDLAGGSAGVNISNGGTVTAVTRTATGSGYTSAPTWTASAPTTAGGTTASGTTNISNNISTPTITSGGTGYTVGNVLTFVGGTFSLASQVTVSSVSGGVITGITVSIGGIYTVPPTNPISVTGGSGTGATFTLTSWGVNALLISNAGSGYVEQPTVTFSGGGGAGAAAYATVGASTVIRSLGSTIDFFSPAGRTLQIQNSPNVNPVNFIAIAPNTAGQPPYVSSGGTDTNIPLYFFSKGTGGIESWTGGGRQLLAANTASAVNYVQVTGAATGGGPAITAQGSDSSINLALSAKGTGGVFATTYFGAGTASTNYIQLAGASTSVPPTVKALGGDTNIPLVLQPKGTGALQAQQTDSTATGGNARGANAVDWQTLRSTNTMVASGQASVLVGGQNNSSTSYTSFVGAGANNTASGPNSAIVAGNASFAPGQWSFIGSGNGNTAGGYYNFIGGGQANSATSQSAVTTQSGTMNGTTAVTLSGSNASIKVGQYITGTSIAGSTYVAAISGTSLTLSQAASGSSTSTLSFYTPHGVVVGGGNNQATGSYSFIGGGGDAGTAGNRNVASGDWSVVAGGCRNAASGIASFVGGGGISPPFGTFPNTASSAGASVVGGFLNTASNQGTFIGGGYNNLSNGVYSAIMGGSMGTARAIVGNHVFPACSEPMGYGYGFSQAALLILAKQTTDATPTVLTATNAGPTAVNQIILPNNSAYYFTGEVVAGVTGGGNTKGWTIAGVIKRGANAAATTLVGSTVTSPYGDAGASTWTIALTADTTNGGLAVTFTGQLATTIRCVAQIRTTEMTY